MTAVTLTETFLGHIFSGNIAAAQDMTAPKAVFIGARPEPSATNALFGTFVGPDGAAQFFDHFADLIEPGEFTIQSKFGTETEACFFGQLHHKIRATGRPFISDWALVTQVSGDKLTLYHFYEDTDALAEAMRAPAAQ